MPLETQKLAYVITGLTISIVSLSFGFNDLTPTKIRCVILIMFPMTLTLLLQTVWTNPGFVPPTPHWFDKVEDHHIVLADKTLTHRLLNESDSDDDSCFERQDRLIAFKLEHVSASKVQELGKNQDSEIINMSEEILNNPLWVSMKTEALRKYQNRVYANELIVLEGFVQAEPVTFKWCFLCAQLRHPRTRHCTKCANCVDRYDHHCDWLSCCIGLRNYRYFLRLLGSTIVLHSTILYLNFLIILTAWYQRHPPPITTAENNPLWINNGILTAHCLSGVIGSCFWILIFKLLIYHLRLVRLDLTTTERTKLIYPRKSPFSRGAWKNFKSLCWDRPPEALRFAPGGSLLC